MFFVRRTTHPKKGRGKRYKGGKVSRRALPRKFPHTNPFQSKKSPVQSHRCKGLPDDLHSFITTLLP